MNMFKKVSQSHKNSFLLEEPFNVIVTAISKRRLNLFGARRNFKQIKHSINPMALFEVKNNDNYCLFYAIELSRNFRKLTKRNFLYFKNNVLKQQKVVMDLLELQEV